MGWGRMAGGTDRVSRQGGTPVGMGRRCREQVTHPHAGLVWGRKWYPSNGVSDRAGALPALLHLSLHCASVCGCQTGNNIRKAILVDQCGKQRDI